MLLLLLLTSFSVGLRVHAATVFAHFMIGNTANYAYSDFEDDIAKAKEAHIDGFALNIAYADDANDYGLDYMFAAAERNNFKLIFSFDYAGNGPWPKEDVISMINYRKTSRAYFWHHGEKPLVSTFEGPGQAADWPDIKKQTQCFFMPSWSSLGAKKALQKENGVADGLFSWAGWAEGDNAMNTKVDASYLDFLKQAGGKPYMMPVSPWFFTNLPGYNKNWLWRGDNAWWDRWYHVWYHKPEYVEIISWNDYGESHHIGPVRENAMMAFNIGKAPYNYALNRPHDAWRMFLPHVIDMYKGAAPAITTEGISVWYRLNHGRSCSTGGTVCNTASQLQTEMNPSDCASDYVFFSALLAGNEDTKVRVKIGSNDWYTASWDSHPADYNGLWHGSVPMKDKSGAVTVEINNSGRILSYTGEAIAESSCTNGINNWNAWTGGKWGSSVSASPVPLSEQGCIAGTGEGDLKDLCTYTCGHDYCPPGPCYCYLMGRPISPPAAKYSVGYPNPGKECTFVGLCAYTCAFRDDFYCTDNCNRDIANKDHCVIPPEPPEPTTTNVPTPTPTYVHIEDPNSWNNYSDAKWQMRKQCDIFDPPNRDWTEQQCLQACSTEIEEAKKTSSYTSYGCVSFTPLDEPLHWYPYIPDQRYNYLLGKCSCDNGLVNLLAQTVVEALPVIAQIGCFIVMSSLKLLVEIGLDAIPEVGQGVNAGLNALISAAKTLGYVYDASQLPEDAFDFWLAPCGGSNLVPDELKRIFGILGDVAGGIGDWTTPKNIPKGSGQRGDKGNPDRPTTTSKTGSGPSATAKDVTITSIASSTAKHVVVKKVCTAAEYSQACYHYYSASLNYPWVNDFLTCTDHNARMDGYATKQWQAQHVDPTWKAFTDPTYEFQGKAGKPVICQADEYPPGYFWPKNAPQNLNLNQGQIIRWIPSNENGGVPQRIWKGFCSSEDGGDGNGQMAGADFNRNLVKFKGSPKKNVNGKTTTEFWDVDFTRAVLSVVFDFNGATRPTPNNDWGLKENPCWPEAIVPEDPGYVLLTDDKWYQTNANAAALQALAASYSNPPAAARLAAAKAVRPDVTWVRRRDLDVELLSLPDGDLAIREANSSRRITEDERNTNVEVMECADRLCKVELAALEDVGEKVVMVEGKPVPTLPAFNEDSKPTAMPMWDQAPKTMVTRWREQQARQSR